MVDKILGTSKMQANDRITLVRQVKKKLGAKIGDLIVFAENDKGEITIRKAQL